jgi:protein-disulfide isomerase
MGLRMGKAPVYFRWGQIMRVRLILGTCVIALGQLAACTPATAQAPVQMQSIQQELETLRATQTGMQKELNEIKALLQKLSAPAPVVADAPLAGAQFSLQGAQIKGAAQAQVVLVEFSDFQCPFCASYAATSYPQITREYVDTGRVRYAFMSFPIESLHPLAFKAHVAAACAGDEGRFWEMHDRLFSQQKAADAKALAGYAAAIGLDAPRFDSCLDSESRAAQIRQAMKTGEALGVNGTPTFLIGVIGSDDKFQALKVISGAKPYSAFKGAIDGVLAALARNDDAVPARLAVMPAGSGAANEARK